MFIYIKLQLDVKQKKQKKNKFTIDIQMNQ